MEGELMQKYLTFKTATRCILTILIITLIIGCQKKQEEIKSNSNEPAAKIVNVDELAASPDQYIGSVGVKGRVIGVNEPENLFMLGCEDACIGIPVKSLDHLPAEDARIVVYGELKQQEDGKYLLFASKIEPQQSQQ